jgi:hypothetical protein
MNPSLMLLLWKECVNNDVQQFQQISTKKNNHFSPEYTVSCINWTLNRLPMLEIFVYLTCINQAPVYSEHKRWSVFSNLSSHKYIGQHVSDEFLTIHDSTMYILIFFQSNNKVK